MIRRWLALTYYLYALRLAALSHFYFNRLYFGFVGKRVSTWAEAYLKAVGGYGAGNRKAACTLVFMLPGNKNTLSRFGAGTQFVHNVFPNFLSIFFPLFFSFQGF